VKERSGSRWCRQDEPGGRQKTLGHPGPAKGSRWPGPGGAFLQELVWVVCLTALADSGRHLV
jgi:hypothetical protein